MQELYDAVKIELSAIGKSDNFADMEMYQPFGSIDILPIDWFITHKNELASYKNVIFTNIYGDPTCNVDMLDIIKHLNDITPRSFYIHTSCEYRSESWWVAVASELKSTGNLFVAEPIALTEKTTVHRAWVRRTWEDCGGKLLDDKIYGKFPYYDTAGNMWSTSEEAVLHYAKPK